MLCFRCGGKVDGQKFCPHCGLRQSPPEKGPASDFDRTEAEADRLKAKPYLFFPLGSPMAKASKKFACQAATRTDKEKPCTVWIKRPPVQKLALIFALVCLLFLLPIMLLKWPGRPTKQSTKSPAAELKQTDRMTKQAEQKTKPTGRTREQTLRSLPLKHKEIDRTRKKPARLAPSQGEASSRATKTSAQTRETSQEESLGQTKPTPRKTQTLTPDPRPGQAEGDRLSRDLDPAEKLKLDEWIIKWLEKGDYPEDDASLTDPDLL